MKSSGTERVENAIRAFLADTFKDLKVTELSLRHDHDYDGDAVLHIQVVYLGSAKSIDTKKVVRLARLIEPKLLAIGESAYPLFSFVSKRDFEAAA